MVTLPFSLLISISHTCTLSSIFGLESLQDHGEQLDGRVEAAKVLQQHLHLLPDGLLGVPQLQHQVRHEGTCLVVTHPVVLPDQEVKSRVHKLQRLHVDGGVGVKELQSDPAEEEVQATNGGVLVRGIT